MTGINPLETTLDRVGRILSQDYHIQVLCKGNECKTDGRTIWLPSLPEDVPESLWQLLRGEIDHEVAHILFTDFGDRMQAFGQKWGAFGHDLLNVIEDVRVNYALARKYPGAGENIQHSLVAICKEHAHRLRDMPFISMERSPILMDAQLDNIIHPPCWGLFDPLAPECATCTVSGQCIAEQTQRIQQLHCDPEAQAEISESPAFFYLFHFLVPYSFSNFSFCFFNPI